METLKEKDMKIGELYVLKYRVRHYGTYPDEWHEDDGSPVIYLGKHLTPLDQPGWRFLLTGDDAPVMWAPRDSRVKKFETFCKKEGYAFEAVE